MKSYFYLLDFPKKPAIYFNNRITELKKNNYELKQIGIIKTPYKNKAPYQPLFDDDNEFVIILSDEYVEGLKDLEKFQFIYVFYFMDKLNKNVKMLIKPPWAEGKEVGLFASRSPNRPNPIGISVVKIKKIEGNKIYTSGLDAFNDTPLIDIKPYIKNLDEKSNANFGWIDEINNDENNEHLKLHIKGIPHTH
jgi:tRNA-Thr(GGU) m(6)t(6)A37 methyltransferase TsaA